MIYLQLFLTFLKIGVVSFGGGYGMIAMIRESVLANGWMAEEELMNFIAVAESTPGPIAVNMATFIGSVQGGVGGALIATIGVVLPSFIIILVLAALFKNLLKYEGVRAGLDGVRPAIVGLILATALAMLLSVLFGVSVAEDRLSFDGNVALILAVLATAALFVPMFGKKQGRFLNERKQKLSVSPIAIILISGLMGVLLY
jgi:chromate transporter